MRKKLAALLRDCEKKFQDHPAFAFCDEEEVRQVSFREFLEDVENRRAVYREIWEERIGLWAGNSYRWIVAATSLLLEGKTVVLLDANLMDEDARWLCSSTDTQMVIAEEEMLEAEQELGLPMRSIDEKEVRARAGVDDAFEGISADGAAFDGMACDVLTSANPAEGSFICFTSGTSKSAKGVVIDVETLCGCVRNYGEVVKGKTGQKFYLPLPYHHIYAFLYIFHLMYFGGTQCIGQMGRYFIRDMEMMRPHIIFTVPSMLRYMLEKDFFPQQLQAILCGGSYLRPEVGEQIREKGVTLYNLYGSSEVLGAIAYSTPEKGNQWLRPVSGNRFFLNERGELGVELPYHMREYYQKPDETVEVLDRENHVFWTGDAADMDGDGYVRIRGRVRDMIVLENGEKVHAEDTDTQLCQIPGVKDGAVIGVDGQLIAVLIPQDGISKEHLAGAVRKFNRTRSAAVRIRDVWIYGKTFPRTNTGKLRRFLLEKEYREREQ